jgi:hypothetical protein
MLSSPTKFGRELLALPTNTGRILASRREMKIWAAEKVLRPVITNTPPPLA